MKCPKCGHDIERDVRYCPRCQTRLGGLETSNMKSHVERGTQESQISGNRDSIIPSAPRGIRHHVIILGYREWYAIKPAIDVIINGQKVGSLLPKGRLDCEVADDYCEVVIGGSAKFLGKKWEKWSEPKIFRCTESPLLLQIYTSRWSGKFWLDQVKDVQK